MVGAVRETAGWPNLLGPREMLDETQMVGRREELRVLDELLDGLGAGGVPVLAVAGEPGIGKSRLLFELTERATKRGFAVVEGRAMEFEREVPFAPIVAALDDALDSLDRRQLDQLGPERLSELQGVFPSLDGVGDEGALEAERYRLHRAVRTLLELLADGRPLVLVLDDMHWADGATLDLFTYLLHRPPRAPVLFALGYRDRQVSERLIAALGGATHERVAVALRQLDPLNESEIHELLTERSLDPQQLREVHVRSGGNPFYAEQLARAGLPAVRDDGMSAGDHVPAGLAAAVATEVEALGTQARRFLCGAAVAGDPFELELAAAAADVDPTDAASLLDALAAADLVRSAGPGARFRFRHPIVRAAVYESAGSGWRIGAHARVAKLLEARGAAPSARAHHVERAALPGDEAARQLLLAAAAESMARAPATAVRWYTAALDLTDSVDPARQLEILTPLAGALAAAGRRELAHARILEALRLVPEDDLQGRVKLTALCAGIEYQIGRPAEANARLVATLASLPEEAFAARAELEIELAVQPAYLSEWGEVSEHGERALATAQASGETALIASASASLALGTTFMGEYVAAGWLTDEAMAAVDAAPDSAIATRLDAMHHLGAAEGFLDRYEAARRHLERGLALSRAIGNGRFVPALLASLARLDAIEGHFEPAREGVENALDAARTSGDRQVLVWALMFVVRVELIAGNTAAAGAPAAESYELTRTLRHSVIAASAIASYATVCAREGDYERCVALMSEARVDDLVGPHRAPDWEALMQSLVALDRLDEAQLVLRRALDRATPADPPTVKRAVDHAAAELALVRGDPADAIAAANRAVGHAQACGAVVDAALSQVLLGRAHAAAGDSAAAVTELELALSALEAIGAGGHRDHAAAELRALGRRVPRRGRRGAGEAGAAALSGRELEVAELVAEGLTNKQIAARLFVSDKTVESHLSHAFDKLGVSNRAAVAAKLSGGPARGGER